MVTTGSPSSPSRKTEILNLESGETCTDLADFPVTAVGGVGANLNGTPIVCRYSLCYKFTESNWESFATLKEKRGYAAGVMFNNKLHIFGGFGSGSQLQTSELISIDGSIEYGPDLPYTVTNHAITKFNSKVSIMSGGETSSTDFSPLTWYFDHETQDFTSGPSLLEARKNHGSATCVDKVTQEKIPIVAGGYGNNWKQLDSTEIFIGGQWQSGNNHCKIVICF